MEKLQDVIAEANKAFEDPEFRLRTDEEARAFFTSFFDRVNGQCESWEAFRTLCWHAKYGEGMISAEGGPYIKQGWLKRKYLYWYDLYMHIFKLKYFVIRDTAHPMEGKDNAMVIDKSEYYNFNEQRFCLSYIGLQAVGFIVGALFILILKRKDKDKKYFFHLSTVQDIAFVEHVTGGGTYTISKEDFR